MIAMNEAVLTQCLWEYHVSDCTKSTNEETDATARGGGDINFAGKYGW